MNFQGKVHSFSKSCLLGDLKNVILDALNENTNHLSIVTVSSLVLGIVSA